LGRKLVAQLIPPGVLDGVLAGDARPKELAAFSNSVGVILRAKLVPY